MKPFRRTQVITLMAACVISTAWGQQVQLVDRDALREQMELARQKAAEARDVMRIDAQAAQDMMRVEINEQTREMTEAAVRMAKDGVFRNLGDMVLLAQDIAPKAPMAPMAPMPMPRPLKAWNFDFDSGSYEAGKSALDNYS